MVILLILIVVLIVLILTRHSHYSGDDFYTCLTMEKRGVNVMEFQMGVETSTSYNQSLCQNEKFPQETWVTQGSRFSDNHFDETTPVF